MAWEVSEIGYGMWGMGAWSGSEDSQSLGSLQRAIDLGCNFFDTAWVYGNGHSEKLLGQVLRANSAKKLFVASKVPPKNLAWPAPANSTWNENYPPEHVTEFVEKSLRNIAVETLDLIQLHSWNDSWLEDSRLQAMLEKLKTSGKVRAVGISLNRWQPSNGVKAVREGLVDSVQVVYNIFDQNPEDQLFPACREKNVAVIARVPFDEGSLTGTLTASSKWPGGDFRNRYFSGGNLEQTLKRLDRLQPLLCDGMTLPKLALGFILSNPDVSTTIPGMRKKRNVEMNLASSEDKISPASAAYLPADLLAELRKHRWDRKLATETFAGKVKRKLAGLLPGR
jgi:aryl-alcohol dehydrogenase-like predicted oxidoreductase